MLGPHSRTSADKYSVAWRALFRYRRSDDYWSPSVHAFWYWHSQQIIGLVRDALTISRKSEAVGVDVGCGDGFLARKLASAFEFRKFVGVDIDSDNVRLIDAENEFNSNCPKILPVIGNVYAVPIASDAADLVICSEVVEHLTDDARAIKELHRVLAPGGTLILATPNASPLPHRLYWSLRGKRLTTGITPPLISEDNLDSQIHGHINVQDARYWKSALERAGFSVDAIRPVTTFYGGERFDSSPLKFALALALQAVVSHFSWGHRFSEGLVISARKPRAD